MKKRDGIKFLTRCEDSDGNHWWNGSKYSLSECRSCNGTNDTSHLRVFGTYGPTSADAAEVAWRMAYVMASVTGDEITEDQLDYCMGLVVNDSDSVRYIIRNYGNRKYR